MTNYEAVKTMKNVIEEMFGDTRFCEEFASLTVDEIKPMIWRLFKRIPQRRLQYAFMAVMTSGGWEEDLRWGIRFYMPSTRDALEAMETVCKRLQKGRRMMIEVSHNPFDERRSMGYTLININGKREGQ